MKRALGIAVFVFCGCFNPDDILPIKGSVETPGMTVKLERGRAQFGRCDEKKVFQETTSGDDGAFTFEVFRAQAQHLSTFESFCMRASTRYPSGTEVSSVVYELFTSAELLPFPDWQPNLTRVGDVLQFVPLADRDAFSAQHTVAVTSADGGLVWREGDVQGDGFSGFMPKPFTGDSRVLDEFGGTLALSGSYSQTRMSSLLPDAVQYVGVQAKPSQQLILGTTQIPLSRGVPCDGFPTPCPLTDGELARVELNDVKTVMLRFPAPVTPSLLVLRDLMTMMQLPTEMPNPDAPTIGVVGFQADGGVVAMGAYVLEYSSEGESLLTADGGFERGGRYLAIPLIAGVPIESLRVTSDGFERLREISVF